MERKCNVNLIKHLMVEKGFGTIVSLSEASGINRNTLGDILNGKIQPSATIMEKLIKALDIPLEDAALYFFSQNSHST